MKKIIGIVIAVLSLSACASTKVAMKNCKQSQDPSWFVCDK